MEQSKSIKTANTDYEIIDLIAERWSPRAFADTPVEQEKLNQLFEAARWAPSSSNEQPWRYIYAHKGTKGYDKLFEALVSGNQEWAKSAPVLGVSIAKMQFDYKNRNNRHAYHDTGMATGMLLIQATQLGLYVHQMGGFSQDKMRELFDIPEGYEPIAAMAIGYLGDADTLSDKNKESELKPRERKPISEMSFNGEFKK